MPFAYRTCVARVKPFVFNESGNSELFSTIFKKFEIYPPSHSSNIRIVEMSCTRVKRVTDLSNNTKLDKWMFDAAEIMVRESKSLTQAATDLGISVSGPELKKIEKRPSFQRVLWDARNKWNKEVADIPSRTKQSTIGMLQVIAQKLYEEGNFDKAAEVLLKLSKLEGWVGEGGQVNVFGSLSNADLEKLKAKVKKIDESGNGAGTTSETLPS